MAYFSKTFRRRHTRRPSPDGWERHKLYRPKVVFPDDFSERLTSPFHLPNLTHELTEADEMYQNASEKGRPHLGEADPSHQITR